MWSAYEFLCLLPANKYWAIPSVIEQCSCVWLHSASCPHVFCVCIILCISSKLWMRIKYFSSGTRQLLLRRWGVLPVIIRLKWHCNTDHQQLSPILSFSHFFLAVLQIALLYILANFTLGFFFFFFFFYKCSYFSKRVLRVLGTLIFTKSNFASIIQLYFTWQIIAESVESWTPAYLDWEIWAGRLTMAPWAGVWPCENDPSDNHLQLYSYGFFFFPQVRYFGFKSPSRPDP